MTMVPQVTKIGRYEMRSGPAAAAGNARRTVRQIAKHQSGAEVIFFDAPGPICSATIAVATQPVSDAGHPHCLEHLIFNGSRKYPHRGYLDTLATRSFSTGTNAWTCQDHTAYTIDTAGAEGLLQVLPVFLDHILHPTLTQEQFLSEVYHLREDGYEAGVVYQEMHGREHTEGDLISLSWQRAFFEGSPLAFASGGRTGDIAKLSNAEVRAFHEEYYTASKLTIIIVGGARIEQDRFLSALDPLLTEKDCSTPKKAPSGTTWNGIKQFSAPQNRWVEFPSNDEKVGSVTMAWRGPKLSDVRTSVALEAVMRFLTENEAAPLMQRFVEIEDPLASSADYSVELLPDTIFLLCMGGVMNGTDNEDESEDARMIDAEEEDEGDAEDSDEVGSDEADDQQDLLAEGVFCKLVMEELEKIALKGIPGGIDAMYRTLRLYRRSLLLELENDPHNYVADALIPDAVHSDSHELGHRIAAELSSIEDLIKEDERFWVDLIVKWLVDNVSRVTVVAVPNTGLGEELEAQKAQSLQQLRAALGENGLRERAQEAAKAVEANRVHSGFEPHMFPPLPDASAIETLPSRVLCADPFRHSVEIDSEFVSIVIGLNTSSVPRRLRQLLELFSTILLCSDVVSRDRTVVQGYPDVVRGLNDVTVHNSAGVGLNSGAFRAGLVPDYIVVEASCEASRAVEAVQLLGASIFRARPGAERVKSVVNNLYSDATEAVRYGESMCRALSRLLDEAYSGQETSNTSLTNVLRQHPLLEQWIHGDPQALAQDLVELRDILVRRPPFFHVAAKQPATTLSALEETWLSEGGQVAREGETGFRHPSRVLQWKDDRPQGLLVPIVGVESAYLRVLVRCHLPRDHPCFYPMEVLSELLSRSEGPLDEVVRGAGLAYGISLSSQRSNLLLSVEESSAPHEAWEAFIGQLKSMANESWEPSSLELEIAKSSVLYQMHAGKMSPSLVADHALRSAALGLATGEAENVRREQRLNAVCVEDVQRVCRQYLPSFFLPEKRLVVVTCSPGSAEAIQAGFAKSSARVDLKVFSLGDIMADS